ncbi:MAG: Fe-S-containing protein [Clostridiales bacterium]|nr:Fe-S-containing protein [Clostridiales bacterium]
MQKRKLWFIAGVIATVAIVMVGCSSGTEPEAELEEVQENASSTETEDIQENTSSTADGGIEIIVEDISTQASYYDTEIDGINVEIFAVLASDGTVRLAMNTCQVCNGSPYAYFEQDGNDFVCQNCGNHFSSDEIGLTSGGCNPVPITEDDYTEENGIITVSESFLEENAPRFSNWKQF